MPDQRHVFVAGATGHLGSQLVPHLLSRGHRVTALAREQSRHKLSPCCKVVIGNALERSTYLQHLDGVDSFVQLVGVAHPGPAKARQFVEIDLKAGLEAVQAAKDSAVAHFVYVSVAQPAPVMQAYIKVRSECETAFGTAD